MMDKRDISKLLAAGGKRWSKYGKDRIYIDVKTLGLEVEYYKTGNVSSAAWQGETISNADGRRLLCSKVYVDCTDGSLHVDTDYSASGPMQLESVAEKFVGDVVGDATKAEETGVDVIMTAESLEAALDAMANEAYAHKGETTYLRGLLDSFRKRFGMSFDEVAKATEPRLRELVGK